MKQYFTRPWWKQSPVCLLILWILTTLPVLAQGKDGFYNVEPIQCSPLTVAHISGHSYLLICNTPDNSLEVWDTDENIQPPSARFLRRIPVGLHPVSVLWNSQRRRFYVTDFLSDSVTTGVITAKSGPASLFTIVDKMKNVGDEPIDLIMSPDNSTLLVTFSQSSSFGAFHPVTLNPIAAGPAFSEPDNGNILIVDDSGGASNTFVMKEPHAIAAFGDEMYVLGFKGGVAGDANSNPTGYDFDLYGRSLVNGTTTALSGLGSTNWNMTFASNGDLFVVGGVSQHHLAGGPAVAGALTGFVTSELYKVSGVSTANPVVISRDVNLENGTNVNKPDALAMLTDVALLEEFGAVKKVFVTAFGSDRIGVISNTANANGDSWTISRINIPVAAGSISPRSGPRGVVVKLAKPNLLDPGDRVYVVNRLDNSLAVIDPSNDTHLVTIPLSQDPTPAYIKVGRENLYSADLSGNGFVSCAVCHVDGRTDSIAWNLGDPAGLVTPFLRDFVDSPSLVVFQDLINLLVNGFEPDKGPMVTQTLQGLLNYELPQETMALTTNAPYHWRGDKFSFVKFNEAFANLLGLGNNFGPPDDPMGIDPDDMLAYEAYVNSIQHPPNPKQTEDRVYSGDYGDFTTFDAGSGAKRGLKLFHIRDLLKITCSRRSCVHCHSLPTGSNLLFTDGLGGQANSPQPLETAQLRNMFQREKIYQVDGYDTTPPFPTTSMFGLTHAGGRASINGFLGIFSPSFTQAQQEDISQYLHELDWGPAPMIGKVLTVTSSNQGTTAPARMDQFEAQAALGNVGVAAYGQKVSVPLGYWFDPVQDLWVEESTLATLTQAQLRGLISRSRDRLFVVCTPLGETQRVSSVSGSPAQLSGPAPTNVSLEPMIPNTANLELPNLVGNWKPVADGGDFNWDHADPSIPTARFPRAIRQFQYGLMQATEDFGISDLRHDAPRRFRVAGRNILPGAKLCLISPDDPSGAPPDTANPPDPSKTSELNVEIYPTGTTVDGTPGGVPIWETAVELAPIVYLELMNGGGRAPGVLDALEDVLSLLPEPPIAGTFDPDAFGWHYVKVVNPDTGTGTGGWSRLKME